MELASSEWITILGLAIIDGLFLIGAWAYTRHVGRSTAAPMSELREIKAELRRGFWPLCDLSGPISNEERERARREGAELMLRGPDSRRPSKESTQ